MADNCGQCLELPERFKCGWCGSECSVQEQCTASTLSETASPTKPTNSVNQNIANFWLNKQNVCPDPQIFTFEPTSGPVEGGTNLTIYGVNLGNKYENFYYEEKLTY